MSHYCKSFQEFAITLALIKDGVKLTLLWCPIFLLSTFVFFLRCNFYNNLTHTYTNKHTHKVYIYIYIYIYTFHTFHDLLQDVRDSGIFLTIDVNVNRGVVAMDITRLSGIEHDISTDYAHSRQNTSRRCRWCLTDCWCCHRRCLNSWNRYRCQSSVFIATDMKNWTIRVIFQQKGSCLIRKFCLSIVGQK